MEEKSEYRYKNPNSRISITMNPEMYKKFIARCLKRGMTAQGVIKELVEAWSQQKITIKKEI